MEIAFLVFFSKQELSFRDVFVQSFLQVEVESKQRVRVGRRGWVVGVGVGVWGRENFKSVLIPQKCNKYNSGRAIHQTLLHQEQHTVTERRHLLQLK